jgi:penicillin-binding protein 2
MGDSSVKKNLIADIKAFLSDVQYRNSMQASLLEKAKKTSPIGNIVIKDEMTWDQVNSCLCLLNRYKSFYVEPCYYRAYPLKEAACHVVGYLSSASDSITLPSEYKCGKTGIEQYFNTELSGEFGMKKMEVNAFNAPLRDLCDYEAEGGKNIETTIDVGLQNFVFDLLSEYKAASCVVMNIRNGHILAMVSVPGYDPNRLTSDKKYWRLMAGSPVNSLINRSIAGLYPPGSTFKPIVALAALKAGVIDKNTKFFCPGHMQLGNRTFHCWKRRGHGYLNLEQALAFSCDVFFYNLGLRLKPSDITEMAETFGIGIKTKVNVPYEQPGRLTLKQGIAAQKILTAIGQGAIISTPIRLCVMAAQLANGGYAVYPTLEKNRTSSRQSLGISSEHINLVKRGMFLVCNMPGASAYAQGHSIQYPMAGKTGTAQVVSLSNKRGHLWRYKDHGLFIAYVPAEQPEYAIAVVVEHGVSGASSCVPVVRKVFDYISRNEKPRLPKC